jgi:exodeoxyribonuclease-3
MATGGDLNRRLMPGCTLAERKNMENFLKLGWIDTFREMNPEKIQYTWWNAKIKGRQNGIGWRIDYIIVNE